jgi:simple sugar transport system permease protein
MRESAVRSALETRDRLVDAGVTGRRVLAGTVLGGLAVVVVAGLLFPDSRAGVLLAILTSRNTLASALRRSVPIAFAALGGIFAEKSGVINIGLEGLLIISAFTTIYAVDVVGGEAGASQPEVLLGLLIGVLASTLLAGLFAVVCIEFHADQIIAGLAVWLIALGLAPFASQVVYESPNTDSVSTFANFTVPGLADLPLVGALFDASPAVYMMFAAVGLSWYALNRTAFGRHVRASGENPKALDTAGVNVSRVRYAAVLLSGVLSGVGGGALALGIGQFTGNGATMVNGRGFIGIVAYLFGNYNPIGAFLATMLFAGLNAIQVALQTTGVVGLPDSLVRITPFVLVIVVLALVGRTRIPSAAGEYYESGED